MDSSRPFRIPFRNERLPSLKLMLVLPVALILAALPAFSQTGTASIQGIVRDATGQPVADAAVALTRAEAATSLATKTAADGSFQFPNLPAGVFSLKASKAGYREGLVTSVKLADGATERLNLTLHPLAQSGASPASKAQSASAAKPAYYDQPDFVVAGVTEATTPGGHGSNVRLETGENLAKETVELKSAGGAAQPAAAGNASEKELRAAVEQSPQSFDANRRLGGYCLRVGSPRDALPYLERAHELNPADYATARDLARAYAATGAYDQARRQIHSLLAARDAAELHDLLGDVEERAGNPLEAVREYQRAVELDPSEQNLFDWGAELLLHRSIEPATEVFTRAARSYPQSERMHIGLGAALYARGLFDRAAWEFCAASDLNPSDPAPYLFLGKIQRWATGEAPEIRQKLERFHRLHPDNARAQYYYALSLWQKGQGASDRATLDHVEQLLKQSVTLDPKFDEGYLQLADLLDDREELPAAIAAYQKAIAINPDLPEAHYRLSQAYARAGEKEQAARELALYEKTSKLQKAESEQARREILEFVTTSKHQPNPSHP